MKTFFFNPAALKARLLNLGHREQVAFSILCIERMLPNYRAFQREHNWGNIDVIDRSIDCGWRWLLGEPGSEKERIELAAFCDAQAPDTEVFGSIYASAALDVAVATSTLMKLVSAKKSLGTDMVMEIVSLCRDTVDMYVQELERMDANSPNLEEAIRLHPLMQAELFRQNSDLVALESEVNFYELARDRRVQSLSNLGLS